MAVDGEQIAPAVVIQIDESDAPAQQLAGAQPRLRRDIGKELAVFIEEKRGQVAGEIGLGQVQEAVVVEVAHRDAHAGLQASIGVKSDARRFAALLEGAVAAVAKQQTRRHVARHIEVRPAVVVEIGADGLQGVAATGLQNAGRRRDVAKGSVELLMIEQVRGERQAARAAHHGNLFPDAVFALAGLGRLGEIEIDVVRDEQVQTAIAVIVEERAAGPIANAR